mmetsp:Transcript_30459/g.57055  ORF Transcript_30459/g.57055 Transcript_30459/m.57055 type:complete len:182 (+) Transcript_30459:43-588(+)
MPGRSRACSFVWVSLILIFQCFLLRQPLTDDFVSTEPSRNQLRRDVRVGAAAEDTVPPAPSFEAGGRAKLTGFTDRTSLNGEPVELIRWDEDQQGWIVRRQSEQSITSLVSAENLEPYPEKEAPAKPKDREFNIVSFLATVIGGLILLATAVVVLVPLVSGLYKDMTGEYLFRIEDMPSLY